MYYSDFFYTFYLINFQLYYEINFKVIIGLSCLFFHRLSILSTIIHISSYLIGTIIIGIEIISVKNTIIKTCH